MGWLKTVCQVRVRLLTILVIVVVVVSILSPVPFHALAQPRSIELAQRTACRNNLTTIWRGLQKYATVHGQYPEALEELVAEGLVPDYSLRCPSGEQGQTDAQNARYVYHPGAWHVGGPLVTEDHRNHREWGILRSFGIYMQAVRYELESDGTIRDTAEGG